MDIFLLLLALTVLDGIVTCVLLYRMHALHNDVLSLRNKVHNFERTSLNHFEDTKSYYSKRDID